jgi:hypothetical protein
MTAAPLLLSWSQQRSGSSIGMPLDVVLGRGDSGALIDDESVDDDGNVDDDVVEESLISIESS